VNKNGIALTEGSLPTSGLAKQIQRKSFVSNNHYSTGVNSHTTNAPESKSRGTKGEMRSKSSENDMPSKTRALHLLREYGFNYIQQPDLFAKNSKGEWLIFEIKDKELFSPGDNYPHWAAGLNKSQLYLRIKLLEELRLRTYLIIFVSGTDEVYGAYLDNLEAKGEFCDTPNGIRIYPISNFNKGAEAIRGDLNGC
jgi:hypothetical protein